ncbi:adenylyl-sulfate kinase [Luteibacter aegosomatissinici]|uniref:adenylyl-sulfate kinase n=1 Tax=Luteibacter aegosomatissinici TaxID=2911539 RepID=UPI001FFA031E|nr:adenylyl-sulfate kinase [Luteibacter aegosomatissinici]UPG94011.1 adenylyl-sulfate kinase [Luteibacter aegosomatissinici]
MNDASLATQAHGGLLRFITCGSVDDGKSSLLGRLLYDAGMVPDDQLAALVRDSGASGSVPTGAIDFALLTDGLDAERQQGITIDVAYRYFHTPKRAFIVADCPGHEQYTRNMATGASTASLAVVLVDARKGLLPQTRRHTYLCALMGIRQVILAVNKMDLVAFSAQAYGAIVEEYVSLANSMGITQVDALPVVAIDGDNIGSSSSRMPWYIGPPLLRLLETATLPAPDSTAFRMPVQWVSRPDQRTRGYAGTVASGSLSIGDELAALPGKRTARVTGILVAGDPQPAARAGQAITVTIDREIDISRGDVLAAVETPCEVSSHFACHVVWMGEDALLPHRTYLLQMGTSTVNARVTSIKHKVDVDTQAQLAATRLELNEVAYCNLETDAPLAFEPFETNRTLGGFILIDRATNATVACGMIHFGLRRSANVQWQHLDVDKRLRSTAKGQRPLCVWLTGLSGSGKSTIANLVERKLADSGFHTYLLDGDNVRHGLNSDLGFTPEARVENIRRLAEVAHLMADAGLIVLVCAISPFRNERQFARERFAEGEFIEVFVDASLDACEARDPKGLYKKARAGDIKNFTGIDSPYEAPEQADVHLITDRTAPLELADSLYEVVETRIRAP